MAETEKKGYAVSPDAAKMDATAAPIMDLSNSFVVIDGKQVPLLELLQKQRPSS